MRRRLARELAVQSLYQIRMNDVEIEQAIRAAIEEALQDDEGELRQKNEDITPEEVRALVEGTQAHLDVIDGLMMEYLKGWSPDRLSKVDREILRLGIYEMIYREDVPSKVVVNEAIEMSKHFGTDESGKFVNGVLGKMIGELETIKANI
jgi:transcription antitermination protein NusB